MSIGNSGNGGKLAGNGGGLAGNGGGLAGNPVGCDQAGNGGGDFGIASVDVAVDVAVGVLGMGGLRVGLGGNGGGCLGGLGVGGGVMSSPLMIAFSETSLSVEDIAEQKGGKENLRRPVELLSPRTLRTTTATSTTSTPTTAANYKRERMHPLGSIDILCNFSSILYNIESYKCVSGQIRCRFFSRQSTVTEVKNCDGALGERKRSSLRPIVRKAFPSWHARLWDTWWHVKVWLPMSPR